MSVVVDISVSLDGFVTGPDPSLEQGLGLGGEALHTWAFSDDPDDQRVLVDATERTGAVLMGRRTFDLVDRVWTDEVGYGAGQAAQPPCFVVTSTVPDRIRLVDRFTIVTDGLEAAVEQARTAAGAKDVVAMGGGDLCGRLLASGLADELSLHVAPVVLGAGTPLWGAASPRTDWALTGSIVTSQAVHLTYRRT